MMQLAHELAQNNVTVAYFSTMLPEQVLDNRDVLGYFASAQFLCLTCPPDELGERLVRREGAAARSRLDAWVDFDAALRAAANELSAATVIDAGRPVEEVEHDTRRWISDHLPRGTWQASRRQ